jgi:hypothetical protein
MAATEKMWDISSKRQSISDLVPGAGEVLKESFINSVLLKSWTFGQKQNNWTLANTTH